MIWEEWKKIWRPGLLVGLLLLTIVASLSLFAHYWKATGPEFGPWDERVLAEYKRIVEKYGTTLSDEEYVRLQEDLAVLDEEMSAYISQNPIAMKYDIKNYSELSQFRKEDVSQEEQEMFTQLSRALYGDETNDVLERLAIVESIIWGFDYYIQMNAEYQSAEEWERANAENFDTDDPEWIFGKRHIQLTFDEHEYWRGIFWSGIAGGTSEYFTNLLIWTVVCLAILLSPLLVRDRMNRMEQLQFCSKIGRRIYYKQYITVLISALALTTLLVLVLGGLFLQNGTLVFADCSLFSFAEYASLALITYGTWWGLNLVMIYLLCMGMAGFLFFLSQFSRSYVGMVVKLIPTLVLVCFAFNYCFRNALLYDNRLYYDLSMKMGCLVFYAPVWMAVAFFIIGLGLGFYTCIRKQKAEL